MKRTYVYKQCCVDAQAALLTVLQIEIKESESLAEFAQTLEDFQLIMRMIEDVQKPKENKQLHLKRGIGCKTCKLRNELRCKECRKTAVTIYKDFDEF